MPPIENEQERREVIWRLEHRQKELDAQRLKAQHDDALARIELFQLNAALERAKMPLPSRDVCLECWISHANVSKLYAVPHEDPAHYDRMKCGACGHTIDRRTGMP